MKAGFRDRKMSPNYKILAENARRMRQRPTEAERRMWCVLGRNNFGVHFRRQHIIGDYIADFACISRGLVIEIDGEYHNTTEQQNEDENRSEFLRQWGFNVIRFTNCEVLNNIENVFTTIEQHLLR